MSEHAINYSSNIANNSITHAHYKLLT